MDVVSCSEVIIKLFTVCVCSMALENDNITLISRRLRRFLDPEWAFSLFLAVFGLSRPLEGRYGRCFVLRSDNQVVYDVFVLYGARKTITSRYNITLSKTAVAPNAHPPPQPPTPPPCHTHPHTHTHKHTHTIHCFWPLSAAGGPLWTLFRAQK